MTKISRLAQIILSLLLATVFMLDSMIVFPGNIHEKLNDVYFKPFESQNLVIFLVAFILTFLFISLLDKFSEKIAEIFYSKDKRKKNIWVYLLFLSILLLCWLPTVLSYFPGGLFSDTVYSLVEVYMYHHLTNYNPALYTILVVGFLELGKLFGSIQLGLELFTVFQVLVMGMVLSYLIYWLYKKGVSFIFIILTTLYFSLVRLIPMYAVSIWKDTPFSLALLLLALFIASTVCHNGENLKKPRDILKYSLLLIAVGFLRNNGIYIATVIVLLITLVYRKFYSSVISLGLIILMFVIQGPGFAAWGLNSDLGFSGELYVPLRQIYYVVSEDGDITEDQKAFLENIIDFDTAKEYFNPLMLDDISRLKSFDDAYVRDHKEELFDVWYEIFKQNPKEYVEAYLLGTIGFWNINRATFDGYINPQMWENTDYVKRKAFYFSQQDYLEKSTGTSIRNIVRPNYAVSSALFLFISLFGAVVTIYRKHYKSLLIYLPGLLTWGTIIAAAPLAFSLRYVYILVLMVPLAVLTPFLKRKKD